VRHAKRLLKNQISADELIEKLLVLSETKPLCLLDSSGVSHLNSHLLICGLDAVETFEIRDEGFENTLEFLDQKLENPATFAFFTISYDFGLKLEKISPRKKQFTHDEPDVFLAVFDCLLIHDYNTRETYLVGNEKKFLQTENLLRQTKIDSDPAVYRSSASSKISSNFTKAEYLEKIDEIKEFIRRGDTYQTNLTQQFTAELPENLTPQQIFRNLRNNNPAPFAAFIQRRVSTVISASPERFFRVEIRDSGVENLKPQALRRISTSPIKGTRPRGRNSEEDERLKTQLLESEKDRAENVMIVDLLRNDLGRICEYGSVAVEKLCDLEQHPTLFHLVSTVTGNIRENTKFSEIIRAVFPCGSITGAPKIRTMQIIDRLESANRGLSMGAIGFSGSQWSVTGDELKSDSQLTTDQRPPTTDHYTDLSVAIRTMVVRDQKARFNVGGGIVIDSLPEDEFEETLTKAKALIKAIDGEFKV
jgi:para-aminobenzoate synthetase component I